MREGLFILLSLKDVQEVSMTHSEDGHNYENETQVMKYQNFPENSVKSNFKLIYSFHSDVHASFLLTLPVLGFLVLMMTSVKKQSQKGQRSQGQHRLVHPTLQPLPYQPLVPSLQPSQVSSRRHFSICA